MTARSRRLRLVADNTDTTDAKGTPAAGRPLQAVPADCLPEDAEAERYAGLTRFSESTRLNLRVPCELYEALNLAARIEGKSRNALATELLTSALSRLPERP